MELPPLRERSEDIHALAIHHVMALCERNGNDAKGLSPEFLKALLEYPWPGNVRELLHCVEGAMAIAGTEPLLHEKHLPTGLRIRMVRGAYERGGPVPVE